MPHEQSVFAEMLFDEEAVFRQLVEKAKRIFKVNQEGNIVLLVKRSELSDRQLAGIALLGRFFASRLDKADSMVISVKEVATQTRMTPKNARNRLSELYKEGLAERVERGKYKAVLPAIECIVDDILGIEAEASE